MKLRVGVFHPGAQHSYQTARAFQESGELAWYATSIFYDPSRWPYTIARYAPRAIRERFEYEFKRRYDADLDPRLVRTFGVWEWIERGSMRVGLRRVEHYANEWGNVQFARRVGRLAIDTAVNGVWGYDTSSRYAFECVKAHGIQCVLEQTIGHPRVWNQLLTEERRRVGEAFDPYPRPYPEADLQSVEREMDLADVIVCGSAFVRDTMIARGVDSEKAVVVPYGVHINEFSPPAPRPVTDGLELLFVGHFGLRKGAWYLLEAMRRLAHLPRLTLTIVGKHTVHPDYLAPFGGRIRHVSHVPRHTVHDLYQNADAYVLPTLFEGSSVSVFEALACGLPVITTPHAGSVVRDGVDGFIVPIRDADALADRIAWLYDHAAERREMGVQARLRALDYSWDRYRTSIATLLHTRKVAMTA